MEPTQDVLSSPAVAVLGGLEDAGLDLAVVDGRLRVWPVERLTADHEHLIRQHRDELVALVRSRDEGLRGFRTMSAEKTVCTYNMEPEFSAALSECLAAIPGVQLASQASDRATLLDVLDRLPIQILVINLDPHPKVLLLLTWGGRP